MNSCYRLKDGYGTSGSKITINSSDCDCSCTDFYASNDTIIIDSSNGSIAAVPSDRLITCISRINISNKRICIGSIQCHRRFIKTNSRHWLKNGYGTSSSKITINSSDCDCSCTGFYASNDTIIIDSSNGSIATVPSDRLITCINRIDSGNKRICISRIQRHCRFIKTDSCHRLCSSQLKQTAQCTMLFTIK